MPRHPALRALQLCLALAFVAGCGPSHAQIVRPLPGPEPPPWGTSAWHTYLRRQTDSLVARDPQRDADSAVSRGDLHLLAISGYALIVPGLKRNWASYGHPIYLFRATGDHLEGPDHITYSRAAYDYAKAYNAVVLAHVPQASH